MQTLHLEGGCAEQGQTSSKLKELTVETVAPSNILLRLTVVWMMDCWEEDSKEFKEERLTFLWTLFASTFRTRKSRRPADI